MKKEAAQKREKILYIRERERKSSILIMINSYMNLQVNNMKKKKKKGPHNFTLMPPCG